MQRKTKRRNFRGIEEAEGDLEGNWIRRLQIDDRRPVSRVDKSISANIDRSISYRPPILARDDPVQTRFRPVASASCLIVCLALGSLIA